MTRKSLAQVSMFALLLATLTLLSITVAQAQHADIGHPSAQQRTLASTVASTPDGALAQHLPAKKVTANTVDAQGLSFLPPVVYDVPHDAYAVVIADVNNDGLPDVITGNNDGTVGIMLGSGGGALSSEVTCASGGTLATSIAVADVNGDGKPDIVVSTWGGQSNGDSSVAVLLGNGNGTFQAPVLYDSGWPNGGSLAVADVNGDGKPDIVILNSNGTGVADVGVLLNNGTGAFQPVTNYDSGGDALSGLAIADINGDSKPDIVLSAIKSNSVSVLLGDGNGTFQSPIVSSAGGYPLQIAAVDVNGDGIPDVEMGDFVADGQASVLFGEGTGAFRLPVAFASGGYWSNTLVVSDVNQDGKPDLIIGNCGNTATSTCGSAIPGNVAVLLGNGNGTFQSAVTFGSGGNSLFALAVGDLNGDGKPDIVTSSNTSPALITVLLNSSTICNSPCPTSTSLTSSLNPSLYGQPVTFAATVTSTLGAPPNGETVAFYNGSAVLGTAPLSGGAAAITTSSLAAGAYSITATYPGDSTFKSSTSPAITQTVQPVGTGTTKTSTTLASSPNPSLHGQNVTLTATVSSAHGAIRNGELVTFYKGSSSLLGNATTQNGVATFIVSALQVGIYDLKATYDGDTTFAPSSGTLTQTVQRDPTTTTLTSSTDETQYGTPITLTAQITTTAGGTPTGIVVFLLNGSHLGTAELSDGVASLTRAVPASGSITAQYNGDSTSGPSTSNAVNLVVNGPYETTTTITSTPNPSTYEQVASLIATVTSSGPTPTGYVHFYGADGAIGDVGLVNGVATLNTSSIPAGGHSIYAYYPPNQDPYLPSRSVNPVQQFVNRAASSVTVTLSPTQVAWGQPVTVSATVNGPPGGSGPTAGGIVFTYGSKILGRSGVNAGGTIVTSELPGGTDDVCASFGGSDNFNPSSGCAVEVVNPAPTTVAIKSYKNPSLLGKTVEFQVRVVTTNGGAPAIGGTVTFSADSTTIGTVNLSGGTAVITIATLPEGQNTITGTYSGTSTYVGGSASLIQTVNP
jgi:Bacterial Ig-like domain (group 3)/FG-GAP-like repeat